jgi:hypothetical protein
MIVEMYSVCIVAKVDPLRSEVAVETNIGPPVGAHRVKVRFANSIIAMTRKPTAKVRQQIIYPK